MKELFEDFIKMQAELPSVLKSKDGQAGQGKFKYADLTEIVDTVRPLLSKFGFAFMQPLFTAGDKTLLKTRLLHKSGCNLEYDVEIDYTGDDIKKFGAAITYYRRYALQSLLGIVADVDADDIPDPINKKDKVMTEEAKVSMFVHRHKQEFQGKDVEDFLKARSNFNGRTLSQNIDDFNGKEDAFAREIKNWLEKHGRV